MESEGVFGVVPDDWLVDCSVESLWDTVIESLGVLDLVFGFVLVDRDVVGSISLLGCCGMDALACDDEAKSDLSALAHHSVVRPIVQKVDLVRFQFRRLSVQFRQHFQPQRRVRRQQGVQVCPQPRDALLQL